MHPSLGETVNVEIAAFVKELRRLIESWHCKCSGGGGENGGQWCAISDRGGKDKEEVDPRRQGQFWGIGEGLKKEMKVGMLKRRFWGMWKVWKAENWKEQMNIENRKMTVLKNQRRWWKEKSEEVGKEICREALTTTTTFNVRELCQEAPEVEGADKSDSKREDEERSWRRGCSWTARQRLSSSLKQRQQLCTCPVGHLRQVVVETNTLLEKNSDLADFEEKISKLLNADIEYE